MQSFVGVNNVNAGNPDVQVAIDSAKPVTYGFGSPMNPWPKFGDAMIARYWAKRVEPD